VGRRGVRAILGISTIIYKEKRELEQFWELEQLCTVAGKRGVTGRAILGVRAIIWVEKGS
jgi:hypothetical protein